MKTKLLILFCFLSTSLCFAQFQKARFQINGFALPYQVSYPDNYDESQKYPLLIFLHGAGERGSDNEKQLVHGKDFLLNTKQNYPAIVIVPQCPDNSYWSNVRISSVDKDNPFLFDVSGKGTPAMETLVALISDWLQSDKIDTKQVYVGGLSMGGMGTFELLCRMPDTFAAAFPICGGGDVEKVVANAKNMSLWMFHGADDSVVPVSNSQKMYNGLKAAGIDVKYTEYPDVNHNSWDNMFKENDFFPWLFNHKK